MGLLCCLTSIWNPETKLATLLSIIRVIGLLKLIELIYRIVWTIKRQMRTTEALTDRYGRGSWAVVTGGSDGIGLAMCKELALRHFNIVIIARNERKMAEAAAEIKLLYPKTEVKTITFDFTQTKESHSVGEYQSGIVDKLSGMDVSILINNAGFMVPGDFDRVSLEEHK